MQPSDSAAPPADQTANRLRELFEQALELAPGERDAWIDAHVAAAPERDALRRLLAADEGRGFLDTPATEHARLLDAEDVAGAGLVGQQVGAFRLVRPLGQGGMAAVFLGERVGADFEQRVAIKLLRRGLYSELEQRLFQRERRVLATLEHPNIAHLIDGGVTGAGVPYLVLEHVDGVPITEYAKTRALDVRASLRLFLGVCRAVEAAHARLIVHRDIKPSNVLVTPGGQVKLLDFGIAKLIAEDDADGATVGVYTPDYAAPEQVSGEAITTATDVYGLGVLLHELLLGMRPEGAPTRRPSARVGEIAAAAPHAQALAPEQLRKVLRGDLDNVVLKALEPEPGRRYASAGALADDIARWLDRRPVAAHPPSRAYRARKFVERHRAGVLTTLLAVLGLFAALGVTLWQAELARREAARANTVRDFLISVFDAARAHLPRDQRPTPEALVEQAQKRLSGNAAIDPATRADLLRTLGEVSLSLSNFERAQALFGAAESVADAHGDAAAARQARVLRADALQRAGANREALAQLRPLLDALRAAPDATLLRALAAVAAAEMATGAPDAAIADRREAAAAARRVYGADSVDAIAVESAVGNTLGEAQRFPEARAVLEPLLARWRATGAPQDDRYVAALATLANATDAIGDKPASEARYRELLALQRRIYTAPHEAIARTMRDLAVVLLNADKFAEAEQLLRDALAMQQRIYGDAHAEIAETDTALGEVMIAQRRFAEGDAAYAAAIAVCDKAQIRAEVCPRARNNLGMSLYRQNRLDAARAQMTAALAERRALFGDDHPTVAYSLSTLSNVAEKQGDSAAAIDLSRQALDVLDRGGRAASREAALIRNGYAQALWAAGRNDDALREIDRTLADWNRVAPDGKARHVIMLVLKAQIERDLGRPDDARRTAQSAAALGVDANELAPKTRELLRQMAGDPPAP